VKAGFTSTRKSLAARAMRKASRARGWTVRVTTRLGEIRCLRVPLDRHPEPGFRWARAVWFRVRLTRDDHACQTIYQARALRALVQGNIKPNAHRRRVYCRLLPAPALTHRVQFCRPDESCCRRNLEQLPVHPKSSIKPLQQRRELRVHSGCARRRTARHKLRNGFCMSSGNRRGA
jgi:hypothetical protein